MLFCDENYLLMFWHFGLPKLQERFKACILKATSGLWSALTTI